MMAQIPLPWQLTDMLCALGLGFLYGGIYFVLQALAPRKKGGAKRGRTGKKQRGGRLTGRQRARLRRIRRWLPDALWAFCCMLFTWAWVLSDSHAVQLRWYMAFGVAAGCWAFWAVAAPPLRRCAAAIKRASAVAWRFLAPLRQGLHRAWRRLRRRGFARSERRRLAFEAAAARRAKKQAAQQQTVQNRRQKKGRHRVAATDAAKVFSENAKKELQTGRQVYYNNL